MGRLTPPTIASSTFCWSSSTLAVVGHIEKGSFSKEGKNDWQIFTEYTIYCSRRRYSLTQSAFETDWSKYPYLLHYLDIELSKSSDRQATDAEQGANKKRPWPDPSSVFVQDNIAVIVLSRPDR